MKRLLKSVTTGLLCLLMFLSCFSAKTVKAEETRYNLKEFQWAEDFSSAIAVFYLIEDPTQEEFVQAEVSEYNRTEPTCELYGSVWHLAQATFEGETYSDNQEELLLPLDHDYHFSHFVWNEDNTAAQASLVCSRDESHTTLVDAEMNEEVTSATCTEAGKVVYTARYEEETESKEVTLEALGHKWIQTAEGYDVTATAECERDKEHTQTETTTATWEYVDSTNTQTGTCGTNITWELIGDELILTGTGRMYDYGYYYESNHTPWVDLSGIKKVIISEGITYIGAHAFERCYTLETVSIPSSVTEIGSYAFAECPKLADITLPQNLQKLSDGVFRSCTSMESIVIPDSVTTLSWGIFKQCENLETVHLPNSITSLESDMFSGCKKLNHIVIPEIITSIGGGAFSGCTSLSDITLHDGITSFGWGTFSNCTSLKTFRVPPKVKGIGMEAFKGCTALESIYLPESIQSFGASAFEGCVALKQIKANGAIKIYLQAFSGCTALETVDIYQITFLGNNAFENCKNLKEVKHIMPEEIEDYAFLNCSSLTDITLFNLIKTVGTGAFSNCTALKNVIFDGTSAEWDAMTVENDNEPLMNASVTYHKPVTAVTMEAGSDSTWRAMYIYYNEPVQLTAVVEPSDAYDKELRYYCTGEEFEYTLTKDGVFTLLSRKPNSSSYTRPQVDVISHNLKKITYDIYVLYKPIITSISCTSGKIKLEWFGDDDMDYYEVYRKEGNGNYSLIASPAATSYTDSNIINGRTYTYKVRAYSKYYIEYMEDGRWSRYSEEKSIVAQTDTPQNPFTDVQESMGKTTYKAILWAYESGIVKGTSATTYSPEADCTRAQLCVMLWRLKGKPAVTVTNNPFSDVGTSLGNTTYKSILWAYDQGIVKGSEPGKFNPGGSTTRAQMAVMLWRLAGKPEPGITESPFADVVPSIGNTTYKAILWAYKNGITKGTDSTHFSPNSECTRAQLAVFLYRLNNLYGYIK